MNKVKGKTGWFNEAKRHSLARKGIRTGRKKSFSKKTTRETRDTWGLSGDITVGLYSDKTLKNIKSGKDKWAATVFMNASTFSENEIKHYPYHLRKRYLAYLEDEDEPIDFYATDEKNAFRFLNAQYHTATHPIIGLQEVTTRYVDVDMDKKFSKDFKKYCPECGARVDVLGLCEECMMKREKYKYQYPTIALK